MKTLSENKKALFNYQLLEKFEAGISLTGQEVKSIKSGRMNLAGSFVVFKGGEAYLLGANVPPYQPKNAPPDYDPKRTRKLLLTRKEINYLLGKSEQKGLTMIPLKVYTNNGKIKVEFGLAKGKQQYDKRGAIKKRELDREMERELKARG
jgi:SsrA-binding protein